MNPEPLSPERLLKKFISKKCYFSHKLKNFIILNSTNLILFSEFASVITFVIVNEFQFREDNGSGKLL